MLIAPGGKVVNRKEGPIEPLEVRRAIVEVLGRTDAMDEAGALPLLRRA